MFNRLGGGGGGELEMSMSIIYVGNNLKLGIKPKEML